MTFMAPGGLDLRMQDGEAVLDDERRQRDQAPAFNAPWQVLVVVAAILASYAGQVLGGGDALIARYGLVPAELSEGRVLPLLTSLFLHGGWIHAGMNALGALAFGAPVARLFGPRAVQAGAFLLFYIVCGVLSGLGYALAHPHGLAPLIGASGAVSGFLGAASRVAPGARGLAPFASRGVLAMAGAWLVINVAFGLFGSAPGSGGAPIAWEAHVAGYAAGLLLVGPFARALRRA